MQFLQEDVYQCLTLSSRPPKLWPDTSAAACERGSKRAAERGSLVGGRESGSWAAESGSAGPGAGAGEESFAFLPSFLVCFTGVGSRVWGGGGEVWGQPDKRALKLGLLLISLIPSPAWERDYRQIQNPCYRSKRCMCFLVAELTVTTVESKGCSSEHSSKVPVAAT